MRPVPSIRQFDVIRALAEHRHVGRTAQALGVTQPALTRTLQRLEALLGVSLFDRQGMEPTVFGEAVLRFAETAVGGYAELRREITLLQGADTGTLVVAMGPYPADINGRRAAALFSSRHPMLSITLRVCNWDDAAGDVLRTTADLAIAELSEAAHHPELEVELVRQEQGYFFCSASHPLAKRRKLALDDLLEFPWVGPSYPARIRAVLPRADKPFGSFDLRYDRFNPRILVETFSMAKDIVLSGNGIGAFVPGQLDDELKAGQCVRLPLHVPNLTLNYGLITKRGRMLSPSAKDFIRIVKEIEGATPTGNNRPQAQFDAARHSHDRAAIAGLRPRLARRSPPPGSGRSPPE
jgi:DNA-binding transcriptional LysR family regulator